MLEKATIARPYASAAFDEAIEEGRYHKAETGRPRYL